MTLPVDLAGTRVGSLVVMSRNGSTDWGQSKWLCKCDCGTEKTFPWPSLKHGVVSCGCGWRKTTDTTKICAACKIAKPHSMFSPGNGGCGLGTYCKECANKKHIARYRANPAPALEKRRQERRAMRLDVLAAYGNKCVCCGESEKTFLAIDHKNNDGAAHRKVVGDGDKFYRWLKLNGYPSEFQILCHNCNWGKFANGGTCPHQAR